MMVSGKRSTFPAVLTAYLPEYVQPTRTETPWRPETSVTLSETNTSSIPSPSKSFILSPRMSIPSPSKTSIPSPLKFSIPSPTKTVIPSPSKTDIPSPGKPSNLPLPSTIETVSVLDNNEENRIKTPASRLRGLLFSALSPEKVNHLLTDNQQSGSKVASSGSSPSAPVSSMKLGFSSRLSRLKQVVAQKCAEKQKRIKESKEKHDIQRFERSYEFWQQVKAEYREEQLQKLRDKIAEDKRCIRAADLMHNGIQYEQDPKYSGMPVRAEMPKSKAAISKSIPVASAANTMHKQTNDPRALNKQHAKLGGDLTSLSQSTPLPLTSANLAAMDSSNNPQLHIASLFKRHCLSPMPVEEEDNLCVIEDEGGENEHGSKVSNQEMPWHHAQLYQLYGEKADYFLYPVMEPKTPVQVQPKLHYDGGHDGAAPLWQTLREESKKKLLSQDNHVSSVLKAAYSAFVRQSLSWNKQPVKRSYCREEDVPEIDRLLDHNILDAIHDYQQKVEIMYRSSQVNRDQTNVLTYNNPLPDINDTEGNESIDRYLPSWANPYRHDDLDDKMYLKWLTPRSCNDGNNSPTSDGNQSGRSSVDTQISCISLPDEKLSSCIRSDSGPQIKNLPRLLFMTESTPCCTGNFAKKFADKRHDCKIPKAFESGHDSPDSGRKEVSPKQQQQQEHMEAYSSAYQPLTMNALLEHSQRKPAQGEGSFTHGATKMWPRSLTVV